MKVSCCHCGKDIGSAVQKQMALYEVGKVVCPHCHKQNKRYVSELDLHIAIMGNMVIYGIVLSLMCFMTMGFYTGTGHLLTTVIMTIIALVIVIVGISNWSLYVYDKAFLKNEWKNYTIQEDGYDVTRGVKRNFYGFISLVIILGLLAMYVHFVFYIVGTLVYLLLMYFKLLKIKRREYEYYVSHK